jgi:hypothetical protein
VRLDCFQEGDTTCDITWTLMNDGTGTGLTCSTSGDAACADTDAGIAMTTADKWSVEADVDNPTDCGTGSRGGCVVTYQVTP